MQFKRCKPWCKPYNTPNQPTFALNCFLFSKMYTADCADHWTKQMLISYFYGWFSNLNQFKRSIPESFKHEYTIFAVPRPSNPPPLPLVSPSPSASMLGSRVRWIAGPYKTRMQHLHVTYSIERRPTLIRGKGICLHIYHILKLQNRISVLNVLLVFEITLCENNLNFGKTKQYAIRQIKPTKLNWGNEIFRK